MLFLLLIFSKGVNKNLVGPLTFLDAVEVESSAQELKSDAVEREIRSQENL
jgi:hypothetical protein